MNWKRLTELFNYALWIWLLAPFVVKIDVANYKQFILKGAVFACVLSVIFYGLDVVTNKFIKKVKSK